MGLSRTTLLLALTVPAAAAAQLPPQGPVEAQRGIVRAAISPECEQGEGDEIVVCGQRAEEEAADRRYRVPATHVSGPADRAGGEQRAAMNIGDDRCSAVGRAQRCSGGIDILGIGFAIVRGIIAARARRD